MGEVSLAEQITDYIIKNKERHYRLAYSYVKNNDDALEVVQESIYKAISTMDSLKTPDYLNTWFYRIIVNTAIDLLRKRKKVVVMDDETLSNYDLSTVDRYADIDLHKALEDLPIQYRSIIVLRFFEDLKIEEIAAVLDENVNTIKTRLYKALRMLRVQLDDCR
ncbi:MAG TPA: RNA polymerase subunit sigma-70 [Lachnospiraceae bacterium]|jgi:RNA polymerase sigma-70 factor (ECF subfamily)|nr:RNA polymerase subunit sigma-70 [Lachnospiraceae bacterium]